MAKKKSMKLPRDRWKFFRELEKELIKCDEVIPIDSNQLETAKSPKFAEIIIKSRVHLDSLFKKIAQAMSLVDSKGKIHYIPRSGKDKGKKKKRPANITDWWRFFPEFSENRNVYVKQLIYRQKQTREPFAGWGRKSPLFWDRYNKLKHDMYSNWRNEKNGATYEMAIQSLAALLVINFECELRRNPSYNAHEYYKRVPYDYVDHPEHYLGYWVEIINEFVIYPVYIRPEQCYIETNFFKYLIRRDKLAFEEIQYEKKSKSPSTGKLSFPLKK